MSSDTPERWYRKQVTQNVAKFIICHYSCLLVTIAKSFSASDSQRQDRGFDSGQHQSAQKTKQKNKTKQNRPAWATDDDNGASVHSAANEYLAIDRDGNCT